MNFLKRARARLVSTVTPTGITSSGDRPATSGRVTIESLSDKLLLNIFGFYLDDSPNQWPKLMHISPKWRRIVFASQRALQLRLLCTHGAPVQKTVDCWPTLHVVVRYGGSLAFDPPTPEDDSNIMAALKQSERVTSISLTLTSSLLERVSTLERPFSELEDLVLLSRDSARLTLPDTFRWGPRLRHLHLTRIAVPALLELLLYFSWNIVDLRLHEVLNPWNASPAALTKALSGMMQLRSLSLHFSSTPDYRTPPPATTERVYLPVLTQLDFRGNTQYLEGLVARIDAPRLGDVEVTFVNEIILELPALSAFIDHTELHKSYRRADILSSEHEVSISLTQPGSPMRLRFRLLCEELGYRILSMARICTRFSAFLSDVEDLRICANRPSRSTDRRYTEKWQESINSFTGVKRLHISGYHSKDIVYTLQQPDRRYRTVLPVLQNLRIHEPGPRYSRLREAVVSLMVSRRLSGRLVEVEYEQICFDELGGAGPLFEQVTIERLSDDILLNIFRQYLDDSPRLWPRLAWVCQRWRHVVLTSPLGLNLRLYCTYGTPSPKTVGCWPTLPVVVQYGGIPTLDPPAPEDEDNIMAALKQSDRVTSISLTVDRSLLEKLCAIERPFSEMEDLVLLSRDRPQLTLPSTFRWGPRLRRLHSTRITFPAQLLSSSTNITDLLLHEVFHPCQLSPETLTKTLSGMAQLRSFSLHFLPTADQFSQPPPYEERVILPVLSCLNFRGNTAYLEGLVAGLDTPSLEDIEITFLDNPILTRSNLSDFIDRIKMHGSHRQAHILSSEHAISISLIQPGAPMRLRLRLFCEPSRTPISSMAQICLDISTALFNVEELRISAIRPSGGTSSLHSKQWLKLLSTFASVKRFYLDANHSKNIVHTLQLQERERENVLPALHKLYIRQPGPRHAPLREEIVSFMVSRRLSGHPLEVEYERPRYIGETVGPYCQQVTIERLSEDILLNIFRRYLDETPQLWPTLAWVCRRWRRIVLTSPLGLNLRLYCTHGTRVLKTLHCWPPLPIVVRYGGAPDLDPPAPEDDDNIIAALKQSGRVSSISLTVTSSLFDKLPEISEPLLELEELVLLSTENSQLTLPSTLRLGPRLRTLHSTRIAIPSFPQLLSFSQDLVDLQLHEIPNAGYFSPEAFVDALPEMTQLRTLTLHFLSFPSRRSHLRLPPPSGERILLPSLTYLKYRGTSKYLDSLVARIDAPRLADIEIIFFSQPTLDASQLGRFIDRIEILMPISQAEIHTSALAISISFTDSSTSTPLRLQISCKQLDWQLSSISQILNHFSPFLWRVESLGINTSESPSGQDGVSGEQWLELIRAFGGAKDLLVAGVHMTDILCGLRLIQGMQRTDAPVLPALRNLRVQGPMRLDGPSWEAVRSFLTSRPHHGPPVKVHALSYQCHICETSFTAQQELERHLVAKHAYRIVCSYCNDFQCTAPGRNNLFREHLRGKHPEVARNDAVISGPIIYSSDSALNYLVNRHSSLRAPLAGIVAPSTTATAHSQ